ncbi:hypothetical protein GCM10022220_40770 [Actinocatenispora rupis]|uniref:Uncharacterized protein n=2 Tax=Actinocatenispora rupis TaxID=519421 RepID=A0A8J3J041_9ACTN|nr:hypothetical protein Aru02nite_04690 [Actinocatenispora rupis]
MGRSVRAAFVVLVLTALAVAGLGRPAHSAPTAGRTVRAGQDLVRPFPMRHDGEGQLALTVSAPGVSWGVAGHESAVLSAYVDGRYVTDVVIGSETPTDRAFFLGHLSAGGHVLRLTLAEDRSRGGTSATVRGLRLGEVDPGSAAYAVAAHAPVLYGRTLAQWGGDFQNAYTDVPLIAWHEVTDEPGGYHQVRYTIVWSNEDGGTGLAPASLMARWGRTTDIEWIYHAGVYQLEVDPDGNAVPGTEFYQAPQHGEVAFAGRYEHHHPVLQTCTDNNNVCDTLDAGAQAHPMRFTPSVAQELPAGAAREIMMDRNPWTYWMTAQEMVREGKTEAVADPATPELSDERNYLYLVVKKTTVADQNSNPWIGAAVGVRLKGDDTLYRSDHAQPGWSVQRDDPAATTVELPPGTTAADIASISVLRAPGNGDNGGEIRVESIERAMFLDASYRPEPYFIADHAVSGVTLTAAAPEAVVWTAAS